MLSKTLQDLDGVDWGEPDYPSHLVTECHRLRTVPLKDFTAGNLRILIGQKFSLDYLVPLALMLLVNEPFVEGDYYEGDLLGPIQK
ncbi:MAG: contact-dependent growth inhibition system immunity protein [Capsulimonas sp.]|uniref:contact-dependent growth inhibition system immunity protein n=1 Tax=Capsulimonas sp. TaxID=2494211 RepID=UPI003263EBA2